MGKLTILEFTYRGADYNADMGRANRESKPVTVAHNLDVRNHTHQVLCASAKMKFTQGLTTLARLFWAEVTVWFSMLMVLLVLASAIWDHSAGQFDERISGLGSKGGSGIGVAASRGRLPV